MHVFQAIFKITEIKALPFIFVIAHLNSSCQLSTSLCKPHSSKMCLHIVLEKLHPKNKWSLVSSSSWHRQQTLLTSIPHDASWFMVGKRLRIAIHDMNTCFGTAVGHHKNLCHWTFFCFGLISFHIALLNICGQGTSKLQPRSSSYKSSRRRGFRVFVGWIFLMRIVMQRIKVVNKLYNGLCWVICKLLKIVVDGMVVVS